MRRNSMEHSEGLQRPSCFKYPCTLFEFRKEHFSKRRIANVNIPGKKSNTGEIDVA